MKKRSVLGRTTEKNIAKIIGKHVFGNLYDIEEKYLKDLQFLKTTMIEAAKIGNLHIIELIEKQFNVMNSPDLGGVSLIALIEESHISLHTWPESRYATLDIYSCGPQSDPDAAFKHIIYTLKPKSYSLYNVDRSNVEDAANRVTTDFRKE